jgi:hypothetical protein
VNGFFSSIELIAVAKSFGKTLPTWDGQIDPFSLGESVSATFSVSVEDHFWEARL